MEKPSNQSTQEPKATHTIVTQKSSPAVPFAIVAGFGLIALAIFFSSGQKGPNAGPVAAGTQTQEAIQEEPINPVDQNDHILGNPNAPIVIVEYSDFDCPFCKRFHETMQQIMDTYGTSGKVAWVYRQFPLEQLHPSAPYIAAASECVAELGGNEAFWTFADLVFGEREINAQTDTTRLPSYAKSAGVSETDFAACIEDGRTKALVEEDFNNGVNIGVRGTPYSIILVAGQQIPINGAQPYEKIAPQLDAIIAQLESGTTE